MAIETARLTWTTREAAEYLGRPERSVQAMCAQGEIPAVKLGGVWMVLVARLCDQLGVPTPGDAEAARPEQGERVRELRRLIAEAERVLAELE
jgi:excisionase family DNA binding protein